METYSPLLTDQYQLIMAYSYWKLGMAEQEAVFHLSFRKVPLQSTYIVMSGIQSIIDFVQNFHFTKEDIQYLSELREHDAPLLPFDFLAYLETLTFTGDIDMIPEGTLVFGKEPVLRIKGPIILCQLLETPLLNFVNFASLIATKASQVYLAAEGDPIIEFGLRRAQGPNGGLTASRSAYLGGCTATSNVLAGQRYNIPISGTQAHSWIMAFPNELDAFRNFAQVMKSNTVLLVDTYDTMQGIKNAIIVGLELKRSGEHLAGIRLDSGNLLELSREARHMLDHAGLYETKIIASGDLDEYIIHNLKMNDAPIDMWGVGTRLVTSYDQPALNAIYKLSALKNKQGQWVYKMKLSNDGQKSTLPGILQVKRFYKNQILIRDIIFDIELNKRNFRIKNFDQREDLLLPIFRNGKLVYAEQALKISRENLLKNLTLFSEFGPKPYPVTLSKKLAHAVNAFNKQHNNTV